MSARPQPGEEQLSRALNATPEQQERLRQVAASMTAPSPAAAGLPLEDVERVVTAPRPGPTDARDPIAEFAQTAARLANVFWRGWTDGIAAALASPAPVPPDADGGEER